MSGISLVPNANSAGVVVRAVSRGASVDRNSYNEFVRDRRSEADPRVQIALLSALILERLPLWKGYRGQGRTKQWRDRVLLVALWIVSRQRDNYAPFPLARDPLSNMIGLPASTIERVVDLLVEVGFLTRLTGAAVRRGPLFLNLTPGATMHWFLPHQYQFTLAVRSILDGQEDAHVQEVAGTEFATSTLESPTDPDVITNVRLGVSTVLPVWTNEFQRHSDSGVLVGCNFNRQLDQHTHKEFVRQRAERLIARRALPGDHTLKPDGFRGSQAEWEAHEIREAYLILEDLKRRRRLS